MIGDVSGWGSIGNKGQLEVIDDSIHHGLICEESNDPHFSAALGADHGVDFIHLTDHLGPAFRGNGSELRLHHAEMGNFAACLLDFPPVGVSVEAVISDCDLAFIRDMGSDPGDELQVVHPLHLMVLFPILAADLACLFIEGEAFQGKERPDLKSLSYLFFCTRPCQVLFAICPLCSLHFKPQLAA